MLICALAAGFLSNSHSPLVLKIARNISGTTNILFITCGSLILLTISAWRREWREFALVFVAMFGVTAVVQIPKLVWLAHWTERPSGSTGGFPRGHTATAFALAFLLSRRVPPLSVPAYILAIAIGWSRVEVHAHWAYQVILSPPIGLAVALIAERLLIKKAARVRR